MHCTNIILFVFSHLAAFRIPGFRWSAQYLFCIFLSVQISYAQTEMGPIVGTVEATTANILYRPGNTESELRLSLYQEGKRTQVLTSMASQSSDFVAKFSIRGLEPNSTYTYGISDSAGNVLVSADDQHSFRTVNPDRNKGRVSVSFASCIDIEPNPIWQEMKTLQPDAIFLMGDTPYIDQSDLNIVRERHRKFLQIPELAALASHTPTMGTWDDHDFGRNNGNGRNMMSGKNRTRQAFVEYRGHSQFGDGKEGVYHKVDLGMMEVFLLDPRFFSQTEPSPVDDTQPTCFGSKQWTWLLESLRASQAPFKILACGAIWEDKKNGETDDMFTYWYERDALLDFIKSEGISGVILLGGDIHVARHLIHPDRLGYDLHDFVISPGHARVITQLDVYHPSLEWSLVEGWQFLTLTADGTDGEAKLIAEFRQPNAKINRKVEIPLEKMKQRETDLDRGRRAHWNFEGSFSNDSLLGDRLDAEAHRGASLTTQGIQGSAVLFRKEEQQFLNIPRSFLNDNSPEHSVSLWFKPQTLPEHASKERSFILESTAEGRPSDQGAWHLSIGLRPVADPQKINLQLYTYTLRPASKPELAPTAASQGPFDLLIPRSKLLDQWNHLVLTFNSKSLILFLNGKRIAEHQLPIPGPASEFGGLVIGGHRGGTGRNFDGLMDEISIWQRILTPEEIKTLANPQ